MAPESLSWGKGWLAGSQCPGCSVPGPKRHRFEVLACSFGNGKEREKGERTEETWEGTGGTKGDLECLCVRVPL